MRLSTVSALAALVLAVTLTDSTRAEVPIDLSGLRSENGVRAERGSERVTLFWPVADGGEAWLALDVRPGKPLVEGLGLSRPGAETRGEALWKGLDPVFFLTVGTRESPPDRPPGMSVFNVFFDSPAGRPLQRYQATLKPSRVVVSGRAGRATARVEGLSAGPFAGALEFNVYAGAGIVHVEAVVSTKEENRAILYDAGLASAAPEWTKAAWFDTEGVLQSEPSHANSADRPLSVRHRAIAVEAPRGSIAAFPPPHQFFFPRDETDNQKTVWHGAGHRGSVPRAGFGVRQTETGGGRYVPWFNAPPGTQQRLGVFYALSAGRAQEVLAESLKFTHGDRYPDLPGRVAFTSHWHMATAVAAMNEQAKKPSRSTPDFVKMFKDMNVRIIHLAEFHGDGHPNDPGPIRLAELRAMFDECRRLSDDRLLFLPGEEANVHLKADSPGRNPGHWLYLFPRPVYWTMRRAAGQPFAEDLPPYGRVYHVGGQGDMVRLLQDEHGLGWTAHPRIKASNWAPDVYKNSDFFKSPFWLGGAWKAMPADLSSPRLGSRVLDLLDDMANWGARKYAPGEVDVFKIDHTHELYGHMNVNYLTLDRAPRFEGDWSPVLDALRAGKFFVTTGEVLLTEFTLNGLSSGSTLTLPADGRAELRLSLRWTFPLRFAEIVSGDGARVYRERIDLTDTPPFGSKTLTLHPALSGRQWARVEAWDVAANGAFSQPVWLVGGK